MQNPISMFSSPVVCRSSRGHQPVWQRCISWLCLILALGLMVSPVRACPFCSAPSKTLSEQVSDASALLEVTWESAKDAQQTDVGSTTFRILKVIKQAKDEFSVNDLITLPRYRPGEKTDRYLLFGNAAGTELDWQPPVAASQSLVEYLQNAPKPNLPYRERLPYFMGYLENSETPISDDAYGEFANAPYEEITPLSSKMPREKLREWLVDPKVSPSRLGLYGLMMGLSGNDEDRQLMEKKILEPNTDFRLGIDGVMGAICFSRRSRVWRFLSGRNSPISRPRSAKRMPPCRLCDSCGNTVTRPSAPNVCGSRWNCSSPGLNWLIW